MGVSDDADSPPVELREHGSGQTILQATRVNAKVEPSLATGNQGTLTDEVLIICGVFFNSEGCFRAYNN